MKEFDPEFDSGCSTCDNEFSMSEMCYDQETGNHTCFDCYLIEIMNDIRKPQ